VGGCQPTATYTCTERLVNGDFEIGTSSWRVEGQMGSYVTLSADTTTPINGTGSAAVDVQLVTGTDWHVQLAITYEFLMRAGRDYYIRYTARSTVDTNVRVNIQDPAPPYAVYNVREDMMLTTTPRTYNAVIHPTQSVYVRLTIVLGNDVGVVTVDDVSFAEGFTPP